MVTRVILPCSAVIGGKFKQLLEENKCEWIDKIYSFADGSVEYIVITRDNAEADVKILDYALTTKGADAEQEYEMTNEETWRYDKKYPSNIQNYDWMESDHRAGLL